jgi:hypothetical protein
MLITTINDNINHGSTDIHKSLQQIGVIWANKHALLNNSNSKKSNSTATESEKNTQEVLRQRHNTDSKKSNSRQLEIVVTSSMIKSDLKKPLKKWRKILEAEPIEILTDIHLKAGHILGFYIRESTFGINGVVVDDKIIYVLDKNIFTNSVKTAMYAFVDEEKYQKFIDKKQEEITDFGKIAEDIYIQNKIKVTKENRDTLFF